MDIKSIDYVYQAVPPYLNNRDLPAIMLSDLVAEFTAATPELGAETILANAKARVAAENTMIWFGVKALSMPDSDKFDRELVNLYNDYARDKAAEMEAGKRIEQIKSKVVSINNLTLDGQPVTSFDDFYARAPKELVQWLCAAVHSTITLGLAERKNFLPE